MKYQIIFLIITILLATIISRKNLKNLNTVNEDCNNAKKAYSDKLLEVESAVGAVKKIKLTKEAEILKSAVTLITGCHLSDATTPTKQIGKVNNPLVSDVKVEVTKPKVTINKVNTEFLNKKIESETEKKPAWKVDFEAAKKAKESLARKESHAEKRRMRKENALLQEQEEKLNAEQKKTIEQNIIRCQELNRVLINSLNIIKEKKKELTMAKRIYGDSSVEARIESKALVNEENKRDEAEARISKITGCKIDILEFGKEMLAENTIHLGFNTQIS